MNVFLKSSLHYCGLGYFGNLILIAFFRVLKYGYLLFPGRIQNREERKEKGERRKVKGER